METDLERVEGGLVTAEVRIPCLVLEVIENSIHPGLGFPRAPWGDRPVRLPVYWSTLEQVSV